MTSETRLCSISGGPVYAAFLEVVLLSMVPAVLPAHEPCAHGDPLPSVYGLHGRRTCGVMSTCSGRHCNSRCQACLPPAASAHRIGVAGCGQMNPIHFYQL